MYTFNSRVRYSETDEYGKLTLTGVMNYFQDCSTFQSEDIGKGITYLTAHHKAWWLTSWQIIIDRYPALGEEIEISTWPYEFKGFYGYRNFTICDKKGNYLVRANSIWFLFDTQKARPVKIQEEDIKGYYIGENKQLDMDYAPRKIKVMEPFAEAEPVTIGKHHIDTNHHVNNAQYVEIAREVLPDEETIVELRVEYKKAAAFKDVVYPRINQTDQGYTVSLCDNHGADYAVIWLRGKK
jgi:acyl-ACP thioesterase